MKIILTKNPTNPRTAKPSPTRRQILLNSAEPSTRPVGTLEAEQVASVLAASTVMQRAQ